MAISRRELGERGNKLFVDYGFHPILSNCSLRIIPGSIYEEYQGNFKAKNSQMV
jgi:hypothetical protein